MANPQETAAFTIDALRAQDEKGQNKETLPEKETLNFNRVLGFLHKNGIVLNNMDDVYTLDSSIKLTGEGSTAAEKKLNMQLSEARVILAKYVRLDIMQEHAQEVVSNQLENLKTPPKNMTAAEAAKVMQAWNYHDLIRENGKKMLRVEETMKDRRDNEIHPQEGITDAIQDKLHDARNNWDKLSSGQKLAMAGIALVGGALLLKSKNDTLTAIKEGAMKMVGLAGGLWLMNKAWYLFTGESAVDMVTGAGQHSTKSGKFLVETFKTNDKGADLINQAMVKIGDNNFMDLLDRYEEAKSKGSNRIEGTRMSAEEAYQAMDIFCNKYNPAQLRKEYSKYNPPLAFTQVMTAEMSRDPAIKLKDSFIGRTLDYGEDKFKQSYNYLSSTGPAVWIGEKYRSIFGKDPTPQEAEDFRGKFNYVVRDPADFHKTIENKMAANNIDAGKKFIDCDVSGISDSKYNLKYKEGGDGYIYVIADQDLSTKIKEDKALLEGIQATSDNAESFLANKYHKNKVDIAKKSQSQIFGSVYIVKDSAMKYLMRYKI